MERSREGNAGFTSVYIGLLEQQNWVWGWAKTSHAFLLLRAMYPTVVRLNEVRCFCRRCCGVRMWDVRAWAFIIKAYQNIIMSVCVVLFCSWLWLFLQSSWQIYELLLSYVRCVLWVKSNHIWVAGSSCLITSQVRGCTYVSCGALPSDSFYGSTQTILML